MPNLKLWKQLWKTLQRCQHLYEPHLHLDYLKNSQQQLPTSDLCSLCFAFFDPQLLNSDWLANFLDIWFLDSYGLYLPCCFCCCCCCFHFLEPLFVSGLNSELPHLQLGRTSLPYIYWCVSVFIFAQQHSICLLLKFIGFWLGAAKSCL